MSQHMLPMLFGTVIPTNFNAQNMFHGKVQVNTCKACLIEELEVKDGEIAILRQFSSLFLLL